MQAELVSHIAEIDRIEAEEYAWVNGNQSAMLTSIENLNATASGVPNQIDTLIETLNTTQTTLQADGVDIIKNVSVVVWISLVLAELNFNGCKLFTMQLHAQP